MSELLLRNETLRDMRARLIAANIAGIGSRVFVDRVLMLTTEELPGIVLYAPDWSATPLGASWEWPAEITITIEIQMAKGISPLDSETWTTEAERMMGRVLKTLCGDGAWRRRWLGPPSIRGQQFLQGGPNTDAPIVGETITLTLRPRQALEWPLMSEPLSQASVDVRVVRPDHTIPAGPDCTINLQPEG